MKPTKSRWRIAPSSPVLFSFLVFTGLASLASHLVNERLTTPTIISPPESFFEGLPPASLARNVIKPQKTKAQGLFWLGRYDARGTGFRLLENAAYFEEAYPGYGEARENSEVWKSYFTKKFEATGIWLPTLNRETERLLSFSGPGCTDLFRTYSADVVLFGNSQMYRTVVPATLASQIQEARSLPVTPKVLMCAEPSANAHDVRARAAALHATGKKAALALWPYSPVFLLEKKKQQLPLSQKISAFLKMPSQEARVHFPQLAWRTAFPITQQEWASRFELSKVDRKMDEPSEDSESVEPGFAGFYFHQKFADDPEQIRRLSLRASMNTEYYDEEKGFDCDMSYGETVLKETVDALLKVSEKVVLFETPVNDFHRTGLPECAVRKVPALLKSLQSDRVVVVADIETLASLDYADFVYTYSKQGQVYFDSIHLNYRGASKVTHVLSSVLDKLWSTSPGRLAQSSEFEGRLP